MQSTLEINPAEGIRGLYVNELTRERTAAEVRRFLDLVDEERRRSSDASPFHRGSLNVVIGRDSRISSPDLSVGVVQALRQSGVAICDVGQIGRPAFDYAVDRLRPHLGIYVTGGVRSAAWTGLDLVDTQGLPWLTAERIAELDSRRMRVSTRLGRSAGRYHAAQLEDEYVAALALQFHALRPIRIGVVCVEPGLRRTIRRLLEQTPCDVHFITPLQPSGLDRLGKTLADIVCERHLDLGVTIAIDGRGCQFVDESGTDMSLDDLTNLLLIPYEDVSEVAQLRWRETLVATPFERELRVLQREQDLPVVADHAGRCWFLGESPACDAILTLARTLEVLSMTERHASHYRLRPAR